MERRPRIQSLGIGVPGLYDPVAGATRFLVNMPGDWAGRPVAAPVAASLGIPVRLINDARAFGLAELRLGAGRGASSMVGLTLGTGVGGVIAVDGRVVLGHDGTAGEVGHQTIDPDGPPCGCGNNGCLEAFARADRIAAACGTATAEAAVEAARAGDAAGTGRAGRGRPLSRHRDRQHDRRPLARPGRHRRRHRGGRRPPARPDPGGAARPRPHDVARPRSRSSPPSSGRGPGRSGRPSTARRADGRIAEGSGSRTCRWPAMTEAAYQPQYRQIEQALRERIAALRPGERLPSDAELCAEFGVSRMTARNAMQRLADGRARRAPAGSRQLRRRLRRPIGARTG